MVVIEVDNLEVVTKSGVKDGKAWSMSFQQIAYTGFYKDGFLSKYPREGTIQLDKDAPKPYPIGKYVIAADSYYFGDFDKFVFGRVKLQTLASFLAEIKKQFEVKAAA